MYKPVQLRAKGHLADLGISIIVTGHHKMRTQCGSARCLLRGSMGETNTGSELTDMVLTIVYNKPFMALDRGMMLEHLVV